MQTPIRDVSNNLGPIIAGGGTAVAGGSGDNTEVDGTAINRLDYDGAAFLILARATLAANKSLAITATVQHADDDGAGAPDTFADVDSEIAAADQTVVMTPTMTDGGSGGTIRAVGKVAIKDLSQLKEWVRIQVTPNLDAANTDTAEWLAIFLGAPIVLPVSLIA